MKASVVTAHGGPEAMKYGSVAGNRMFRSSKRKGI
jgi:hypothetical protein